MNVGTFFTKSTRTFPERLAIAYGDYELTYRQANDTDQQAGQCPHKFRD